MVSQDTSYGCVFDTPTKLVITQTHTHIPVSINGISYTESIFVHVTNNGIV